jgi:hypothetical protein
VELVGYGRSRYREQRQDRVLQRLLQERLPIDYGASAGAGTGRPGATGAGPPPSAPKEKP